MKMGLYRNHADAMLVVRSTFTHPSIRSLGGIYIADTPPDGLFAPTTYLVTDESMQEAGYTLITPCTCADPLPEGEDPTPCEIHGWSTR